MISKIIGYLLSKIGETIAVVSLIAFLVLLLRRGFSMILPIILPLQKLYQIFIR